MKIGNTEYKIDLGKSILLSIALTAAVNGCTYIAGCNGDANSADKKQQISYNLDLYKVKK